MNWSFDKLRRVVERGRNLDVVPIAAIMVLTLILLWADIRWIIIAPIQMIVIAGLFFKKVRTDPRTWCVLTALLAGAIWWDWYPLDNHQYLFVYLCLMLFCVFHLEEERRSFVLSLSARLLVGGVMAMAVLWKAVTPDYLSGEFFHFTLLTHHHLQTLAMWFGGLSPEVLAVNEEQIRHLQLGYLTTDPPSSVALQGGESVGAIAALVTWWTIGVEAMLAVLFLWPRRLGGDHRFVFWARHVALIAFIVAIYPLAPVIGFGWALIILGFCHCAERPTYFRPLYIGLLLFLLFSGYAA